MSLIINNTLVVTVVFIILVRINLCNAACNLSKIFRTPRDFDHLEIVERAGFVHSESTTTPQPSTSKPNSKSTKKNGNNCAKAHVSVRFGTDYGGSNNIMKIPPQCRHHLVGNQLMSHHLPDTIPDHNFFYPPPQPYRTPPPCPSHQYYHPYPPPVPYVFPNYYFWSPEQEPAFLPPQLNEYFRRHPDFVVARYPYNEEVFVQGRPVRRGEGVGKIMIPADYVNDGKIGSVHDVNSNNLIPMGVRPMHVIQSRLLSPTKERSEEMDQETKQIKRDCATKQNDGGNKIGNTISMEFSDSIEVMSREECDQQDTDDDNNEPGDLELPEQNERDVQDEVEDLSELNISAELNSTKEFSNELERLLMGSLVEYTHKNCSGSSKMLVSYPIITKDAILRDEDVGEPPKTKDIVEDNTHKICQCTNATTVSMPTGKNFIRDVDDLVSVLIEIIDTGDNDVPLIPITPSYPDYSSPPVQTAIPTQVATRPYLTDESLLFPDVMYPFTPFLPEAAPPPSLSTLYDLVLRNFVLSSAYQSALNSQVAYPASSLYEDSRIFTNPRHLLHEPISLLAAGENTGPHQYVSLVSRSASSKEDDLVPAAISYDNIQVDLPMQPREIVSEYCRKCGHKHSGGNYCDKCGHPLMFYPSQLQPHCPSCAKETRQLNEW